jgi:Mediator complex subunit Med5
MVGLVSPVISNTDRPGESQPLYDEFGSVLLLILASKRRLSLSKDDIGMTNPSGFVSHYLDQEGTERALQDFTDDSKSLLGDWINALYVAEVLSDDLTTTCSPQEFYLFIPTLLRQSLLAFQAGKLSQDVLKVGLEYLLTPFLLPSLVSALSWLNAFDDAGTLMLPIFMKAPETDEAARGIHKTILSMNALSFSFDSKPAMTLDSFQGEVIACVTSSTETNLPAALEAVLRTQGIEASLAALLNALLHFSGSTEFLFALDIVATLTCTADRRLRHLLLLKHASLGMLIKKSPLTAEAIVHLHRRVQAYASVLVVQEVGMDFTTLQLANIEATAANMEVAPTQDAQTDQPMDDIDQVLNESATMSMGQGDTGLDIDDFYGLQNDMGNLDDLDLEMFQ